MEPRMPLREDRYRDAIWRWRIGQFMIVIRRRPQNVTSWTQVSISVFSLKQTPVASQRKEGKEVGRIR